MARTCTANTVACSREASNKDKDEYARSQQDCDTEEAEEAVHRTCRKGRFERLCDEQLSTHTGSMSSERIAKKQRPDSLSVAQGEVRPVCRGGDGDDEGRRAAAVYNDECRWCWEGGCRDRRPLDVECSRRGIHVSMKFMEGCGPDWWQMHVETLLASPPPSPRGESIEQGLGEVEEDSDVWRRVWCQSPGDCQGECVVCTAYDNS